MSFLRFNFQAFAKTCFSTATPQLKSLETLRSSLPIKLQSDLKPDLSVKQLSSALKMVSKGLNNLPSHWFLNPQLSLTELPKPGALEGWSAPLRKTGGRNHHGKITVRHRGGGFKRRIRILDTSRKDFGKESWVVERIEHDPNRSGKIALVRGKDAGELRYILATEKMKQGSLISNTQGPQDGSCLPLKEIPLGSQIHSIESNPGRGGQLVRAAGTCATLVGKDLDGVRGSVRLPSGTIKKLLLACRAVIGRVSNIDWQNRVIGKAGRNRNLGRRPTVRGVAMNAVDHPHGGGKGGRSKALPRYYPMGASSSKLAPETAGKLQASTHFDKKEINQLYISFIKECPGGRMGRDDLLRVYRQFFPFGNAAPFVDRMIKILSNSAGGNGIEFADYVMGLSVISRGRLDEKLYWSFKFCDVDSDGWISRDDLLESIELIHQLMGNMFQLTNSEGKTPTSSHETNAQCPESPQRDTFTPLNRTEHLFTLMDEDRDGKADYNDFKRTVLNDAEIIQGFLVYDGVV